MAGFNAWVTANIGWLFLLLAAAVVALGVALVVLASRLHQAQARYAALIAGTGGGNLQAVLDAHVARVQAATEEVREVSLLARRLERDGRVHFQKFGFLRFNPFRDAGGDQSFALALADQDGNGVVLSSLHGRDGTRVYGKPLVAWESTYPLTEEEQQAIKRARGS
jgi:hypothetical protein